MAGIAKLSIRVRFWSSTGFCFFCTLLFASLSFGEPFKVIRVYSGDIIKAEQSNNIVKIRLMGIDAPETAAEIDKPGQPFSEESRVYLSQLIFRKTVDVISYGYDIENRIIGVVFLDGKNINLEMVRAGLAEAYTGKTPPGFDLKPFLQAEKKARMMNKGIWSLGEKYTSPSQWRKLQQKPTQLADLPELKEIDPKTVEKGIVIGSKDHKETTSGKSAAAPKDSKVTAVEKSTEASTEPKIQKEPTTVVTGIDIEIGETSERVLVYIEGFSLPKAFDIDGENPRIVIDIWDVAEWKGKNRIPSNGKIIKQIRTYLHKTENRLRIVLDLDVNPFRDYSISQLYDVRKKTYWLKIE